MDANELMIGDWVQFDNGKDVNHPNGTGDMSYVQVESIGELAFEGITRFLILRNGKGEYQRTLGALQPIPLTPEILEMNYGKETRVGISDKPCWGEMGAIWSTMLWKCENSFWLEVNTIAGGFVKKHILYVHELQHALRLAGIKKEIVLCGQTC